MCISLIQLSGCVTLGQMGTGTFLISFLRLMIRFVKLCRLALLRFTLSMRMSGLGFRGSIRLLMGISGCWSVGMIVLLSVRFLGSWCGSSRCRRRFALF